MIVVDGAAPDGFGDVAEWHAIAAALSTDAAVPVIRWAAPRTPAEAAYIARWGVADWPEHDLDAPAVLTDAGAWLDAARPAVAVGVLTALITRRN